MAWDRRWHSREMQLSPSDRGLGSCEDHGELLQGSQHRAQPGDLLW